MALGCDHKTWIRRRSAAPNSDSLSLKGGFIALCLFDCQVFSVVVIVDGVDVSDDVVDEQ